MVGKLEGCHGGHRADRRLHRGVGQQHATDFQATLDDFPGPSYQLIEALGLRAGPGIFRACNMRLGKEHMRTHLQDQRLVCAVGLQQAVEFIGLKQLRGGYR